MLLFVLLIIIGLLLLFVPARFLKDNKILCVSARILGIVLITAGAYFVYGIYTDSITFPFN